MKKNCIVYLLCIFVIFLIGSAVLFDFNSQKKSSNNDIVLSEVAHTVFYAPLYVAIENKYFKNFDINIDLILANGADKVMASVLSGDADIGFSGSEATIYIYNGGEKDYLQTFSQLTQKDGSFIVSRKKINNFSLNDLIGKNLIGGRAGGMPEMTLEYVLKNNNINPKKDLNINTSIAFSAMSNAFISGEGDFVTLFEPTASKIEKMGYGYIVSSVGNLSGNVPYTSFSAKKSFINNNKNLIKNFDKAIQMGLDFVHNHSDEDVAKIILSQFPDTSFDDLVNSIKNYRNIDAWPKSTKFSIDSFNHLQDIMIDYGQLKKKVSYNDLIYKIK